MTWRVREIERKREGEKERGRERTKERERERENEIKKRTKETIKKCEYAKRGVAPLVSGGEVEQSRREPNRREKQNRFARTLSATGTSVNRSGAEAIATTTSLT